MIEKGEPQKVSFSLRLVLSKLRFMNRSEDLSTLNHMVESKFPTRTTNQKRYPDLGSDASSVWNFCVCISDAIWRGNVVASPNVDCFLRLGLRVKPAKNYSARTARR